MEAAREEKKKKEEKRAEKEKELRRKKEEQEELAQKQKVLLFNTSWQSQSAINVLHCNYTLCSVMDLFSHTLVSFLFFVFSSLLLSLPGLRMLCAHHAPSHPCCLRRRRRRDFAKRRSKKRRIDLQPL